MRDSAKRQARNAAVNSGNVHGGTERAEDKANSVIGDPDVESLNAGMEVRAEDNFWLRSYRLKNQRLKGPRQLLLRGEHTQPGKLVIGSSCGHY